MWTKGNTDSWLYEVGIDFAPGNEREERIYLLFKFANSRLTSGDVEFLLSKPDSQLIEVDGINILCGHSSNRSNIEPLGIMTSTEELEKFMHLMIILIY